MVMLVVVLMVVLVVQVRGVVVVVVEPLMSMRVRVLTRDRRLVRVSMMAVVMAVGMLVSDRLMSMPVSVALGEVEEHAARE